MRDDLPLEIQEWLQDIGAHQQAAERIAKFFNTFLGLTRNETAATQLTANWMMVCYGFPKNMPQFPTKEDD